MCIRDSCMDAQMATYFVTIQPQDLIAGRISRPYVVFAQCMEGDGIDKTGYCIDVVNCEKELERMKADAAYSREDCMQAEEMIQFWKTENTNTKIRQQFPKSWAGSMLSLIHILSHLIRKPSKRTCPCSYIPMIPMKPATCFVFISSISWSATLHS